MTPAIIEPSFMRRLEGLRLRARRHFAGLHKGERRSPRSGSSIEFLDYRNYHHGDDPRYVDWNAYGRLERLFLKLHVDDEDLRVDLLVDCSRSMDFGSPSKLEYGKRLAAALAYVSLANHDRLRVLPFSGELGHLHKTYAGRAQLPPVLRFIAGLPPQVRTGLNDVLRSYGMATARPGALLLISDLLDPAGYEDGLKFLRYRGFDITVIHLLAADEMDPDLRGDLLLIDAEDGTSVEFSAGPQAVAEYRAALNDFRNFAERFCVRHGLRYLFATNETPLEDFVRKSMRAQQVLE